MARRFLILISFGISIWIAGVQAMEDSSSESDLLATQNRGLRVLEKAIQVTGAGTVREAGTIRVHFKGKAFMHTQSPKSSPPFEQFPFEGFYYVELDKNRLVMEEALSWPDFTARGRVLVNEHGAMQQNLNSNQTFPASRSPQAYRDMVYRRLPHVLLIEARKHPESIRWIRRESYQNRAVEIVDSQNSSGEAVRLEIDESTGRLMAATQIISDPLWGDVQDRAEFSEYQQQNGLWMPSSYRRVMNEQTIVDIQYGDFQLGAEADLAKLPFATAESAMNRRLEAQTPSKITFEELAQGVHLAKGIGGSDYNSLIVDLGNGLLIGEAPLSSEACEALVEQIRGRWPDQPIRYVVATHHHDDHSGGIRSLVASGATVITTKGNEEFFRTVVEAPRSLRPDLLAHHPKELKFHFVENGKLTIPDTARKVEILQLSAIPHVEEMLVVWLPESSILFQGDLFRHSAENPEPARVQAKDLVRLIEQQNLRVKSIAGVHGDVATPEILRAAIRAMEQQPGQR